MLAHTPLIGSLMAIALSASTLAATRAEAIRAEMCFGHIPTLVGKPGRELIGTDGSDVVITNDAWFTETGAGNDLICITGTDEHQDGVNAGDGDDRVDATVASTDFTNEYGISLGNGSDEFIGGSRNELVWAGTALSPDGDVDIISTAAGRDSVFTVAGDDVVDLGPGRDQLSLAGNSADGIHLGGPGHDTLYIDDLAGRAEWNLNNREEQATRDGAPYARWSSFTLFKPLLKGPLVFVGADIREAILIRSDFGFQRRSTIDLRMRGGADKVRVFGGANGSKINGGKGVDFFSNGFNGSQSQSTLSLDLSTGAFSESLDGEETRRKVVHFENAELYNFGAITITGTSGPNELSGLAYDTSLENSAATIHGRAGNDRLLSAIGNDTLVGGPGHDITNGAKGTDRCDAEVRRHCES